MDDATWKETRPGRWERPQTYLERINILTRNVSNAIGRDNWAKNAVAKLEFSPTIQDPAAYLRTAWKQVRYNHPEIAAFPYGDRYIYRVGDEQSIALWVSATFSVAEGKTVDELLGRIPRNEQMMCYFLPDTSEVMIWSPHYRVDARGAIFCLNHLVESLANMNPNLVFGGCAKNLTPSMELTLGIGHEKTPEIEAQAESRLAALEPHKPALELTPTIKAQRPGYTQRHFVKLCKRDTKAIMDSCETLTLAIDVALHAALISGVAKLVEPKEARSFMASFHSNLRTLIPEGAAPENSPTSYTSVITTEVMVSPQTNFDSYYSQLAPVYAAGYAPYLPSSPFFHKRLEETHGNKGEADGLLHPRFAFLGEVDEQVSKNIGDGLVKVRDFWLGAETLTTRMMVHTWVWEGQLVLSVCYNESYWDRDQAASLIGAMQDSLMEVAVRGMLSRVDGVAGSKTSMADVQRLGGTMAGLAI
ncbi:benzoate 4-monooxygenase cytochrome p450 [Pyrenophora seminiperda CCB06]|uniref:Benzoate 4-monooxygenase cytochrome p450 n=1 Tax=Pyrenophora seminiperda CCB06 TaxID=1302712 RepID=A0A3M7M438_9PLEO|nr:benzoate 4-monooxygenase cytochrome p450 [Pyrenophora seminiperda CCB06]